MVDQRKSLSEQLREIRKPLAAGKSGESELSNITPVQKLVAIEEEGRIYFICPECGSKVRSKKFNKHLQMQHGFYSEAGTGEQSGLSEKTINLNEFIQCDKCNLSIKKKNLERHVRRVHGNRKPKRGLAKNNNQPSSCIPPRRKKLSPKDAAAYKRALGDAHFDSNKEITDYLERNPVESGMGKFGVPQDKYRWGFYGAHSMEYDVWRKGDKEK